MRIAFVGDSYSTELTCHWPVEVSIVVAFDPAAGGVLDVGQLQFEDDAFS